MHKILLGLGYFFGLVTIIILSRTISKVGLDNLYIYIAGTLVGGVLSGIFTLLGTTSKAKNDAKVEAERLYIQSGGETKSAANARRVKEIEQEALEKIQDKTQKFENETSSTKADSAAELAGREGNKVNMDFSKMKTLDEIEAAEAALERKTEKNN